MGEKKEEKEDKKEEKNQEKKDEKKGEKKEEGPITVVIKVDMHCEGCAHTVKKSVKGFPGVEDVKADINSNKLTVIGKVDPNEVCERVQKKTRKRAELISPLPKKDGDKKPQEKEKKAGDDKKEKEPSVATVVLKVNLHCEGCTQEVSRTLRKVKGVQAVETDLKNDKVTVKGTMDPNTLVEVLYKRNRKIAQIVPQKKEGEKKDGEKKDGEKKDGGDNKKDAKKDDQKKEGGAEKKEGDNKKKDAEDKKGADESKSGDEKKNEGKKSEAPAPIYVIEYVHPPQIFSDENPNACSVM